MTSLNDQFENMTPAQKAFVLNMLVNKVLKNPKKYGLGGDGVLRVGDRLDFTGLFENVEEIKSILDKAKQTIVEGGPQEKLILANNEKIAGWVKENPDAKLANNQVPNILGDKPKTESVPELRPEIPAEKIDRPEIPSEKTDEIIKEQIQEEIKKAEERIAELEKNKKPEAAPAKNETISANIIPPTPPRIERTFSSDRITQMTETAIETAFNEEIDKIYGSRKFLRKVDGVNSPEWVFMNRLSAKEVLQYARKDSLSKLSVNTEILDKSAKHQKFINTMISHIREAGNDFEPYENEKVGDFFKRLGGFVMKKYTPSHQGDRLRLAA